MQISSLELFNFGKHEHKLLNFLPGSNIIIGPNYSGKSTMMRAIAVGLYGNRMTPIPSKLLVRRGATNFKIILTLRNSDKGLTIQRTMQDSSITREGESSPYVVGHTQVNEEVARILQMDRGTFQRVFLSEQGSPQQLLAMEGAELQRFIESVTGLDDLDSMQKLSNQKATTAKTKAEALTGELLDDGAYNSYKTELVTLGAELVKAKSTQQLCESAHKETRSGLEVLQKKLLEATTHNKKANEWYAKKNPLKAQLDSRPELDLIDTTALNHSVFLRQDSVNIATSTLSDLLSLLSLHDTYEASLAYYDKEISILSAKDMPITPEKDLADAEAEIREIDAQLRAQAEIKSEYLAARTRTQALEAQVSEVMGSLNDLGAHQIVPELTDLITKESECKQVVNELTSKLSQLTDVWAHAECPTCHRPFDASFDKAAIEQEMLETKEALRGATSHLQVAAHELASERNHLEKVTWHNREFDRLSNAMNDLSRRLEVEMASLASLPRPMEDSVILNSQQAVEAKRASLQRLKAANTESKFYLAQLEKLKQGKLDLLAPADPRPDSTLVDTLHLELNHHKAELKIISDQLTEALAKNEMAKASNSIRLNILSHLKGYPDELDPVIKDISKLNADVETQLKALDTSFEDLSKANKYVSDLELKKQPLEALISSHERVAAEVIDHLATAKIYGFLFNLISSHRDLFMTRAKLTLFEVASEFAQIATNGDIQEVLIHEGAISYREGAQVFPKDTASGAQKSIIGLGMKLGIAQLVVSDFDTFILDEVSADMAEDTSISCMGALDMLCSNSITVTHRHLDTAGSVIQL